MRPSDPQPSSSVDRVELVAYDSSWPTRYAEIAEGLRERLGGDALRVEHVGSTAIPGLSAKPIIDVLVEVADHDTARTSVVPALLGAGYTECYWRFDSRPGHFQCVKRDVESFERRVHIHLLPADHPMWGAIVFRDFLRTHSDEMARYERLKQELAARFADDREAYTAAKSDYIREVIARASTQ